MAQPAPLAPVAAAARPRGRARSVPSNSSGANVGGDDSSGIAAAEAALHAGRWDDARRAAAAALEAARGGTAAAPPPAALVERALFVLLQADFQTGALTDVEAAAAAHGRALADQPPRAALLWGVAALEMGRAETARDVLSRYVACFSGGGGGGVGAAVADADGDAAAAAAAAPAVDAAAAAQQPQPGTRPRLSRADAMALSRLFAVRVLAATGAAAGAAEARAWLRAGGAGLMPEQQRVRAR